MNLQHGVFTIFSGAHFVAGVGCNNEKKLSKNAFLEKISRRTPFLIKKN